MLDEVGGRLSAYNGIVKEQDDLYRGVARALGMPDGAFWILYTLRTEPEGLTQSEICSFLYQPKQTVNSALKKLEADGYIARLSGADRRSKRLRLTDKGLRLAEKTVDRVVAAEHSALLSLSEPERQAFIGLFRQYTDALKREMRSALRPPAE